MADTLAREIEPDWVSVDHLNENYRPVLNMVRELIGVVPNCNPILEIWPTGFRTFNLLVPNMLNLPAALVGHGAPKDLVGIAMYASSNAAGCPYCTAHHCSFAIRRGADPDAVLGDRSPAEAAVADLAEAMAVIPHRVTPHHVEAIERHLRAEDIEWIVMAVSLGGFLNKFMDAMGVQLEEEAIADVQALLRPTGWTPGKHDWSTELIDDERSAGRTLSSVSEDRTETDTSEEIPVDNLSTYLRVFRQAPGAVRLDKGWTKGVSGRIGPTLLMLEDEVGYAFPILASIGGTKVVKAIATALRDNLDPAQTAIGIEAKLMAGLVYAAGVGNEMLAAESMLLFELLAPDVDASTLAAIRRFAEAPMTESIVPSGLSSKAAGAAMLARAATPSPAEVNEITVSAVSSALTSAEIVEVVVWVSMLQMLNRLYAFYDAKLKMNGDLDDDPIAAADRQPSAGERSPIEV